MTHGRNQPEEGSPQKPGNVPVCFYLWVSDISTIRTCKIRKRGTKTPATKDSQGQTIEGGIQTRAFFFFFKLPGQFSRASGAEVVRLAPKTGPAPECPETTFDGHNFRFPSGRRAVSPRTCGQGPGTFCKVHTRVRVQLPPTVGEFPACQVPGRERLSWHGDTWPREALMSCFPFTKNISPRLSEPLLEASRTPSSPVVPCPCPVDALGRDQAPPPALIL